MAAQYPSRLALHHLSHQGLKKLGQRFRLVSTPRFKRYIDQLSFLERHAYQAYPSQMPARNQRQPNLLPVVLEQMGDLPQLLGQRKQSLRLTKRRNGQRLRQVSASEVRILRSTV